MTEKIQFAVCVENSGYEGALELRKLYAVIADASAEKHNQVRVIDESGEDYLYPRGWFMPIELPEETEEKLVSIVGR